MYRWVSGPRERGVGIHIAERIYSISIDLAEDTTTLISSTVHSDLSTINTSSPHILIIGADLRGLTLAQKLRETTFCSRILKDMYTSKLKAKVGCYNYLEKLTT